MPELTRKLGIKKPKGIENVSRGVYNENMDIIDDKAASQLQVDEPFYLLSATYSAANTRIDCTFGKGRITFLNTLVAKTVNSTYSINAPIINSDYYIYIQTDGSYVHNTSLIAISGAVPLWKISVGSALTSITTTDLRGQLSGSDARAVQDNVNTIQNSVNDVIAAQNNLSSMVTNIINSLDPLGVAKPCFRTELPSQHLWCDGKTIGDAQSGGTSRANADVYNLFCAMWASPGLLIYTSAGASSTKGTNATDDWNAHKRLALPDLRGRTIIGTNNIGGTGGGRVRDVQANTIGGTAGEDYHSLTGSENGPHYHDVYISNDDDYYGGNYSDCGERHNYTGNTSTSGSGAPHNNMQPYIAANYILRY